MDQSPKPAGPKKPCQFCGELVPVACSIVGCSTCQRENMRRFKETHPHLFVRPPR